MQANIYLNCPFYHCPQRVEGCGNHRRQSSEGWGIATPRFWDEWERGSWGVHDILYPSVQEFEMRTLPKVVTFQK